MYMFIPTVVLSMVRRRVSLLGLDLCVSGVLYHRGYRSGSDCHGDRSEDEDQISLKGWRMTPSSSVGFLYNVHKMTMSMVDMFIRSRRNRELTSLKLRKGK